MSSDSLFDDLPVQNAPRSFLQADIDPVWTSHKAQLIARYLRYFVFITKHGCYIDGFAGPKDQSLHEAWAAELVIQSQPEFLREFFLSDTNPKKVAELQKLVQAQGHNRKRTFDVQQRDFNLYIDDVLASGVIQPKKATFCLLDQFSCQCHWATVQKLAWHKPDGEKKIEQFYFLASGWLERTIAAHKTDDAANLWYGSDDWKLLKGCSRDMLAIRFCERFRDELGYTYVSPWPIYQKEKGEGRVMFHMIHASDHPEAPKQMRRAYRQVLDVPEPEEQLLMEFEGR